MFDVELRKQARDLASSGCREAAISRALRVSPSTIHRWLSTTSASDRRAPSRCFQCDARAPHPEQAADYAYLLGQYLGDGHLVTSSRVPVLRIYGCTDYPHMLDEITDSIVAVRGRVPARMGSANSERLCTVQSYWNHWPCLFPQHGPGKKHERAIVLTGWQQEIVAAHPWPLIRGLIHSDGCRAMNRVTAHGVRYSYPRYFFSNESADILLIMATALDRVGVAWRFNRPNSISIARRGAVAIMDAHVGPKR